jgi:hypothetical protein
MQLEGHPWHVQRPALDVGRCYSESELFRAFVCTCKNNLLRTLFDACLSSSQGCSTTDFAKIEGCVGQRRQKPQIWAFVRINDPTQGYIHQEKLRIIMQKGPTILGHIGHKHRKIIANKERSYNIIQPSKT